MNAQLAVQLASGSVRLAAPMNATERAIYCVIQQWHLAGVIHALHDTTPDQPAADPDDEHVEMLQRVACSCGC